MAKFNERELAQPCRPMRVGEVKHIHVKDRDGSVIKTLTLIRTARPYADDLADAYSEGLPQEIKDQGKSWAATASGELRLGRPRKVIEAEIQRDAERMERERQAFNHRVKYPVTATHDAA